MNIVPRVKEYKSTAQKRRNAENGYIAEILLMLVLS